MSKALLDDVKQDVLGIGFDALRMAIIEIYIDTMPQLILANDYNVTFQDPTKPPATVFRRFQCFAGDSFELKDIRRTEKNLIFLFAPGQNVARNMRNRKKGAGLNLEWRTAEFTMNSIKSDRMNALPFLTDVLHLHKAWTMQNREQGLYVGEDAGSW